MQMKTLCGDCGEGFNALVFNECPYCLVMKLKDEVTEERVLREIAERQAADSQKKLNAIRVKAMRMKRNLQSLNENVRSIKPD